MSCMCHIQVLKEAETRARVEVVSALEAQDEVERRGKDFKC